ncbi:MAG: ABC transporter substrate-binding protein [Candidatus Bipolaricaulia bacterium]
MKALTKKNLILIFSFLFLFASLTSVAAETNLQYWTLFSGGEGDYMSSMVEEFNQSHPDITVEEQRQPWGEYYQKLTTAMAGGNAPDIAIMHTDRLPTFVAKGTLYSLDGFLDKLDEDDFANRLFEGGKYKGHQYAVPLDTHPYILFYNKQVLREAGLTKNGEVKVPSTVSELNKFSSTIEKKTDFRGMAWGNSWQAWWSFYSQLNGQFLTEEGKPAFNNSKGLKATKALKSLITKGGARFETPYNQRNTLFKNGKIGFKPDGVWNVGPFHKALGSDLGITLFPVVKGGERANWANSHNFVLPKQPQKDSEKLSAAFEFIRWVTAHSSKWAEAGHIPARISIRQSDKVLDLPLRQEYVKAADIASYPPSIVNWVGINSTVTDTLDLVAKKGKTAKSILSLMKKRVKQQLEE